MVLQDEICTPSPGTKDGIAWRSPAPQPTLSFSHYTLEQFSRTYTPTPALCAHACVCAHVCACTCVRVCALHSWVCACVCMRARVCVHMHMCVCLLHKCASTPLAPLVSSPSLQGLVIYLLFVMANPTLQAAGSLSSLPSLRHWGPIFSTAIILRCLLLSVSYTAGS